MKAILVIDMPDSCLECQFTLSHICEGNRYKTCSLKPMPMKRISTVDWLHTETQTQSATSIGKYPSDYTQIKTYEPSDYDKGWNDCVEFLEGEEND